MSSSSNGDLWMVHSLSASAPALPVRPGLLVAPPAVFQQYSHVVVSYRQDRCTGKLVYWEPLEGLALIQSEMVTPDLLHVWQQSQPAAAWQRDVWSGHLLEAGLSQDHPMWLGQGGLIQGMQQPGPNGEPLQQGTLEPELLEQFSLDRQEIFGFRCPACAVVRVTEEPTSSCASCGGTWTGWPLQTYLPTGALRTIEQIIQQMGEDPNLVRFNPGQWRIRRGSAWLTLSYAEDKGCLCADVALVKVGEDTDRNGMYHYLLAENNQPREYGFAIQDGVVFISRLIPDAYLNIKGTARMLNRLLEKSDEYDNHLVSVFGAKWLSL